MPRTFPPSPSPTATDVDPCHVEAPPLTTTDLNIMVLVAAIICAFLCALGLNSMLQCVVRCANRVLVEPVEWVNSRRLNANTGLKKKEMLSLPTSVFISGSCSPSSPRSGCAICLTDYAEGEKIRVLPICNHRFHVACVDKWLRCHSSCPTCRIRIKSNGIIPM